MDMWLDIFLRGILIGLVVSMFSIGPVGVLCIQRTLSKGQRSGFFSGLGAATADTVYATVAFFAIAFVHGFIEQNQLLLKIIGGAFVVVVGLYIFFQNPVVQIRRNRSGKVSLWRDFLSIFLFTIANPAISLVFVGLFAMFGISNDVAMQVVGIGFIIGVIQDSCETGLNSSSDVVFTATAEYRQLIKEGKEVHLGKDSFAYHELS